MAVILRWPISCVPIISLFLLLFNSTLLTSFKVSSARFCGRWDEETALIVRPEHRGIVGATAAVAQVAGKLQCTHTHTVCSLDVFHFWKPIKTNQTAAGDCKKLYLDVNGRAYSPHRIICFRIVISSTEMISSILGIGALTQLFFFFFYSKQ